MDVASGLLLYLPLNEVSASQVMNQVTRKACGRVWGAKVINDPEIGRCMQFDGVDDYVDVGSVMESKSRQLTWTMWVKPTAIAVGAPKSFFFDHCRTSCSGDSNNKVTAWCNRVDMSYGGILFSKVYTPDQWVHVAIVFNEDTASISLYLNGEFTWSGAPTIWNANSLAIMNMVLGRRRNGTQYFKGSLAHVRMYERALTKDEIRTLAAVDKLGSAYEPLPAPVVYLPLRATADDASAKKNPVVATDVTFADDAGFGKCATFNGTTSQIVLNGVACPQKFTLAAWVKRNAEIIAADMTLMEFGNNFPYFGINNASLVANGLLSVTGYKNNYGTKSLQQIPATWTHVAVTVDDLIWSLYIDGKLVRVYVSESKADRGTNLGIGYLDGQRRFQGSMAEVVVFDSVLSADAVAQLAARTKTANPMVWDLPPAVTNTASPPNVLFQAIVPTFNPKDGTTLDPAQKAAAEQFYKAYGDDYDFLIFVSEQVGYRSPYFFPVRRQPCQQLGDTGIVDNGAYYGSPKTLKGIIWLPITNMAQGWTPPTYNHELLHYWGVRLKSATANFITGTGSHWGLASTNGSLGGFDLNTLQDVNGKPITDPLAVGPGSKIKVADFSGGASSVLTPYSEIELYLMGLVTKDQLDQNIYVMKNPVYQSTEGVSDSNPYDKITPPDLQTWAVDGFEKVTLDELATLNGGPPPAATQTKFRAAFILISAAPSSDAAVKEVELYAKLCGRVEEDRPPSLQEDLRSTVNSYKASGNWWTGGSIGEQYYSSPRGKYYSFEEATGGRMTMDVRLTPKPTV